MNPELESVIDVALTHIGLEHREQGGTMYLFENGSNVRLETLKQLAQTLRDHPQITWDDGKEDPTLSATKLDLGTGFAFRFIQGRRVTARFEIRADGRTRII